MEGSALRIRKTFGHGQGSCEPHAPEGAAPCCGMPRAVEGIAFLDRRGQDAGPGSGRRAALRAFSGLPDSEKGNGDVQCPEHPGAELSGEQMERRRLDGGRELPLGGTRTRESCRRLPARIGFFPERKTCVQLRMADRLVAYLDRHPDADDRLTTFLLKYPVSSNSVDALYWLGRNAERAGNVARSRSLYGKAAERFPQTYFGNAAAARLAKLGPGEENPPEFLEKIPPPPALRLFY